jgi:hypothetical protein
MNSQTLGEIQSQSDSLSLREVHPFSLSDIIPGRSRRKRKSQKGALQGILRPELSG